MKYIINKLIRKINSDIKNDNYKSTLEFINCCKTYEELITLRERRILFRIASKPKNKKVCSLYIAKMKEINKLQYVYEKNYIHFLRLLIPILNELSQKIIRIEKYVNNECIYTNLYRLGKYNDTKKLKLVERMLDGMICDEELNNKKPKSKKQTIGLNLDKFTQIYTDMHAENERLIALVISRILNQNYNVLGGYFDDSSGKEYFDEFIKLLQIYEQIYNLHDEVCYSRYVIKNIVGKKIYLKFNDLSYERTRITGQRRENIRQQMAKYNKKNNKFTSLYEEVIKDVVTGMKLLYEEREIGYLDATIEQIIEEIITTINEELNYEDEILNSIENNIVKASYLILIILISQWKVTSNLKTNNNNELIQYFHPINLDAILDYIKECGIKVDSKRIEDIFVNEHNNANPYNLMYKPFVRLKDGHVWGINYLIERMDWSLFIRQSLINGGDISKKYGSYMEQLIEVAFREHDWSIIARGYKIKEKNNIVTDCDLITYKNGLLLLIQIKSSTKGKSPYDNWCVKNTIKKVLNNVKNA